MIHVSVPFPSKYFLLALVITSLISECLLTFYIVFRTTSLPINLKKSFSKSFFAFFLALNAYQCFLTKLLD